MVVVCFSSSWLWICGKRDSVFQAVVGPVARPWLRFPGGSLFSRGKARSSGGCFLALLAISPQQRHIHNLVVVLCYIFHVRPWSWSPGLR